MIRYSFERIQTGRWIVVRVDDELPPSHPSHLKARTFAAHRLLLSRPNGYA